jgi:hypothetical protein
MSSSITRSPTMRCLHKSTSNLKLNLTHDPASTVAPGGAVPYGRGLSWASVKVNIKTDTPHADSIVHTRSDKDTTVGDLSVSVTRRANDSASTDHCCQSPGFLDLHVLVALCARDSPNAKGRSSRAYDDYRIGG